MLLSIVGLCYELESSHCLFYAIFLVFNIVTVNSTEIHPLIKSTLKLIRFRLSISLFILT